MKHVLICQWNQWSTDVSCQITFHNSHPASLKQITILLREMEEVHGFWLSFDCGSCDIAIWYVWFSIQAKKIMVDGIRFSRGILASPIKSWVAAAWHVWATLLRVYIFGWLASSELENITENTREWVALKMSAYSQQRARAVEREHSKILFFSCL